MNAQTEAPNGEDNDKQAGTERSARFDRRRQEILRAAARTFAEKGYHKASLTDVAQLLNVTKPALYYYARSKDDLLFECGRAGFDELDEATKPLRKPTAPGLERLKKVFERYAKFISGDFGRLFVRMDPNDLPAESRAIDKARRRGIEVLVEAIIQDGIDDGSIRPCDPRMATLALFGAFNTIGIWFSPNGRLSVEEVAERFLDTFVSGLAAQLPSSE